MFAYLKNLLLPLTTVTICSLCSCQKEFKDDNYTAYFGGEIVNPNNRYVLLLKDNEVIDSILLDDKNRFFKKIDSLAPGMYTFKHEPEYQYIYFDKNDSLMIRLNTKEFDNSLVFCGRGDLKNNFLIEMFLKNEEDHNASFDLYDKDYKDFTKSIDSSYNVKKSFYLRRKTEIGWDENFDQYAKAYLDLSHLAKKEIYPIAHKRRTGEDVCKKLPKDYYRYRKDIDFNNEQLSTFVPFVRYLNAMLNNHVYRDCSDEIQYEKQALDYNIQKLNITDTLIDNVRIKNAVLNNIAFMYLLEDQNMSNNKKFFDRYFQLSTDDSKHNEIRKISDAVQHLSPGNELPKQDFINVFGEKIDFKHMVNGPTVVFFWTVSAKSHFEGAHKKAMELKQKYPNLNFIAVNIDESKEMWENALNNYNFTNTVEIHASDAQKLKAEWVITKIHRTILLKPDGTIKNAFISLFEPDFGSYLK